VLVHGGARDNEKRTQTASAGVFATRKKGGREGEEKRRYEKQKAEEEEGGGVFGEDDGYSATRTASESE